MRWLDTQSLSFLKKSDLAASPKQLIDTSQGPVWQHLLFWTSVKARNVAGRHVIKEDLLDAVPSKGSNTAMGRQLFLSSATSDFWRTW